MARCALQGGHLAVAWTVLEELPLPRRWLHRLVLLPIQPLLPVRLWRADVNSRHQALLVLKQEGRSHFRGLVCSVVLFTLALEEMLASYCGLMDLAFESEVLAVV